MLSFTFFDSAEWITGEISLDRNPEDIQYENDVLCAATKRASTVIDRLNEKVLNQRKELRNLNKALEREHKRNKELEELYSRAQRDVSILNLKVMELNQGIRDSEDLTWKEKYDELEEKHSDYVKRVDMAWKEKYAEDSKALNGVINELRKRLKEKDNKMETLELGIKELSEANDDLKKKIRCLDHNDMYALHLKDRCSKAERAIETIKGALVDGDYIHGIDLRRNDK